MQEIHERGAHCPPKSLKMQSQEVKCGCVVSPFLCEAGPENHSDFEFD